MSANDLIVNSIAYIEANLHQDLGVSDVARSVSYSQFYLSREFSRLAHLSLYDYIMKRKLTEAYKLLLQGNSRIVDVAFHFGFQSHEVFTRAFRKAFGINPSEVTEARPLAYFERVDEDYLAFLHGLKVALIHQPTEACFFQVDSPGDLSDSGNLLAVLSEDGFACKCLLRGVIAPEKNHILSFHLASLRHDIRIYHPNARYVLRYYTDHFYEPAKAGSHFILLRHNQDSLDIMIPD